MMLQPRFPSLSASENVLIGLDPINPLASTSVLQYNGGTMTMMWRWKVSAVSQEGGQREAFRLTCAT
jgi:hypothetical protein